MRTDPLRPGDQGDVRELHPLADGLHHVLDVQQDGRTRLKVLQRKEQFVRGYCSTRERAPSPEADDGDGG